LKHWFAVGESVSNFGSIFMKIFLKIVCAAYGLFFVFGAMSVDAAPKLSKAEVDGRAFVSELLRMVPREELDGSATIQRRGPKGRLPELRANLQIYHLQDVNGTWANVFTAVGGEAAEGEVRAFAVYRQKGKRSKYSTEVDKMRVADAFMKSFTGDASMQPFAGSDFWIADFGFEFLAWDDQRKVKEEMQRSQWCVVLESRNLKPAKNGYSRIKAWFDKDTNGLVQAYAYDADGKWLKIFKPTSFKKIEGQYHLKEMEIRNVQTRTVTKIIYNLKARKK